MKRRLSRRKFIASAAFSIVPSAIAYAQPKSGGLLALFGDESRPAKPSKTDWKEAGVIDLNNSPYATLKTVPVRAVAGRTRGGEPSEHARGVAGTWPDE
jgi:hypothetical protein